MGLLCIIVFFGCSTIEIEEKVETIPEPKKIVIEIEPVPLLQQVEDLLNEYNNDPKLLLNTLLKIVPSDNFEYNQLISRLYLSTAKYNDALEAIYNIPEFQKDLNNLEVIVMCQLALLQDYTPTLEVMLGLDKKNIFALNYLASYQIQQDDLDKAENNLFEVYYQDSENSMALVLMGDLALKRVEKMGLRNKKVLSQREEKSITALYNRTLQLYLKAGDSNNPSYYVKLSNVYNKLGNKLDAINSLDRAIKLDSTDIWNYYDRGKLFFYTNSYEKALQDFNVAYSIDPEHFFTNVFLGRVNYSLNNSKDALFHYSKALKINPNYTPAYKEVSILYYISGDKERSLDYLIRLYKSKKDRDPFLPLFLVNSLFESGKDDEAKKLLQNLVKYEKNSTMKGIYKYYLDPRRTGDRVLNNAMNVEDDNSRLRFSYYVSYALIREGVSSLSETLLREVLESGIDFESKLAMYKLGEI